MWKIGAGAVPLPRLALPSRCSRCWAVGRGLLDAPRMRAGQCPAPTIKKDGFRIHVGAAISRPSLPPSRGKVPPKRADEGDLLARIIYGGRPKGLPYPNQAGSFEICRAGACPRRRSSESNPLTSGPVWDRPLRIERTLPDSPWGRVHDPPASLPPSRGPIPPVRGKWPKAKGGRDRCRAKRGG